MSLVMSKMQIITMRHHIISTRMIVTKKWTDKKIVSRILRNQNSHIFADGNVK